MGAADVICEIAFINHSFFFALSQSFSSETFFDAFLEELSMAGIDYEVTRKEPLRMCGIEAFG